MNIKNIIIAVLKFNFHKYEDTITQHWLSGRFTKMFFVSTLLKKYTIVDEILLRIQSFKLKLLYYKVMK